MRWSLTYRVVQYLLSQYWGDGSDRVLLTVKQVEGLG